MKKLLLYALPLLLYACYSDNETIRFLEQGINEQVELLKSKTNLFHLRFEEAMQDPKTRNKVKLWYDKSNRISLLYNKTFDTIAHIQTLKSQDMLTNYAPDTLINRINQYQQAIQEEIDDTLLVNSVVLDNLQTNDIQNDIKNQELILVLTRLYTVECEIQKHLFAKLPKEKKWSERLEAVVLPIRQYVQVGQYYEAEILLTTSKYPIYKAIINNQLLPLQDSCSIYKVTPTKKGTYYWQGVVYFQYPWSDKEVQYRINSWYVVY